MSIETQIDSTNALNSNNELSLDSIHSSNKPFLDGLITEFGPKLISDTWNKIAVPMKERFISGDLSISDYSQTIRKRSISTLVNNVIESNQSTIEKISSDYSIVRTILSEYSVSELKSFAKGNSSLSDQTEVIIKKINQFKEISSKNKAIIRHFEKVYTPEHFQSVFQLLPPATRNLIESGSIDLSDYIDELKEKCDDVAPLPQTSRSLPSDEELVEFFKTAKVIKYEPGANGVFIVKGIHKEQILRLVIKQTDNPTQELFGTEVISNLNIKTPATRMIDDKNATLFPQIQKVLEKHTKNSKTPFTIMQYIQGVNLENLATSDLETTLTENPEFIYDQVLFELGEMAVGDFLLYYQDRLPTIGMGNLANVMIVKDEQNRCTGAVAIDQPAYLSNTHSSIALLHVDPYKRIEKIVTRIAMFPDEISTPAKEIFFEAIPPQVQAALDEPKALAAIQNGILTGLSKVMISSKEKLKALHAALPESDNPRDQVDLSAHLKMLETIKTTMIAAAPLP